MTIDIPRYPENYDEFYYLLFTLPLMIKAKAVLETGLHRGNSTRIFLESAKIGGFKVYTCDVKDYPETRKRLRELGLTKNWIFIMMDSIQLGKEWINEPIDLLYLDSHHTYEHVYAELTTWSKNLSDNALILIHDTFPSRNRIKNEMYRTGGPVRAIERFIKENPEWTAINLAHPEGMAILWRQ